MRLGLAAAASLVAVALLAPAIRAEAPDPAVQRIQPLCDTWIDTMKHATELGVKGRYDKMKPAIDAVFNFPFMVRYIVGSEVWTGMQPAQQQKLVAVFARYTAAVWADRLDGYSGEKFVIDPVAKPRGQDRIVMTKLVGPDETTSIDFRMRQDEGTWKVIDVYYKNTASQLATEHDGDAPTVQAGGAAALEKAMEAKTERLLK